MPLLDGYLLDNYLLEGPAGGSWKYATGVALSTSSQYIFETTSSTGQFPYIQITGLSFRPVRIIVRFQRQTNISGMVVYNKDTRGSEPVSGSNTWNIATWLYNNAGTGYLIKVYELEPGLVGSSILGFVSDSGFRLPALALADNFVWEAWG